MPVFEAKDVPRMRTELSPRYVAYRLRQVDFRNADDHLSLPSVCGRFSLWFSPPDNRVNHAAHTARFGIPGTTLLGSSHPRRGRPDHAGRRRYPADTQQHAGHRPVRVCAHPP